MVYRWGIAMEVVIIVNEQAGHGRAKKQCEKIMKELTVPVTLERTAYTGHAAEIVEKYVVDKRKILFIAIGGDGTMHEVVEGTHAHSHAIVGMVKGGSGNDFSRAYSTFKNAQQIEQFLLRHEVVPMDLGKLIKGTKQSLFINNGGFGFDALVTYRTNQSKLKKLLNRFSLGKVAYAWIVFQELIRFTPFDLTINNEKTYASCYFVVVSNQPYFGGGMKISPQSKADDHLLELTIVYNIAKWKLLLIFGTVFFGKHTRFKAVQQMQATSFDVTIHGEVYGHVDGEFIDKTVYGETIHYEIMPHEWQLAVNTLD